MMTKREEQIGTHLVKIVETIKNLENGQELPGGCDHCDATTIVHKTPDGEPLVNLETLHLPWCRIWNDNDQHPF